MLLETMNVQLATVGDGVEKGGYNTEREKSSWTIADGNNDNERTSTFVF